MQHKVFYSWQSDHSKTNRGFIQSALDEVAKGITKDDQIDIEAVIDRDTKGLPGSPDIDSAIFKKIAESAVFVADVTFVTQNGSGRLMPNPNVLLELGYALRVLGWERIILVFNSAYGDLKDLPFDLRQKRAMSFNVSEDSDAGLRREQKKQLITDLDVALRASLAHVASSDLGNSGTDLIKAIYDNKKIKTVLFREELYRIFEKIQSIQPKSFLDGGTYEDFFKALEESLPILKDLVKITNAMAICSDIEIVQEFIDGYGWILEKYNAPKDCTVSCDKRDFEFYRFLGYEVWVIFIASLLKEQRFDLLLKVFESQIPMTYLSGETGFTTIEWTFANHSLEWLIQEGKKTSRINLVSDLMRQRHVTDDVINFDDFLAADFLLFLRNEFDQGLERGPSFRWLPWSCLYLNSMPLFIHRAEHVKDAERVMKLLNYSGSIEEFKKSIKVFISYLNRPFQHHVNIREDAIDRIGLK